MTYASLIALALLAAGCDKQKPLTVTVPTDAVDANASGETANCYIVKPGSTVVFSAEYKGNSKSEKLGEVASAELVWQDAPSLIAELYYVPDTRQIVARTAGADKAGNALVAAKDASGDILWSWHLWVADYDPQESLWESPANSSGTVWKFMDRNMGAASASPDDWNSRGMLYQWGRKDPFNSPAGFTEQAEDYSYIKDGEKPLYKMDGSLIDMKTYEKARGMGSFDASVLNPDVFYKLLSEAGPNEGESITIYKTKDWKDLSDDDSWGGVSFRKTINDPCPVGYKVPVCDADGGEPYAWHDYEAMTWDEANHGAFQDGQWWPAAGTRVNYSGGLDFPESNPYGGMWIGTAGKASSNLEEYPQLYGQYAFIIDSRRMYNRMSKDSRAQCLSVRCVAE